jgi:ribosomal protein S12 methylthiotransferase accessory factor
MATKTYTAFFPGGKKVDVNTGTFVIKTDQSRENGGDETAPEPFALFMASIVTCAGIYAKSFCITRDIPTDNIQLTQDIVRNQATGLIESVNMVLQVDRDFPEKYDKAILKSMNACTVKKQLRDEIEFSISIQRD